ncbi:MAG: DNA topoisomerase IV [Flavobacteriaceae bacterium]|nr:DNA topoisomerase IV [Flavobacteriaceae bacterium]
MRYLTLLLLITLLTSCYNQERKCENFRTGTFEFEAMVGTEILKTTFVRNDSIEIDYFRGKADTSSIRWINDCEYILKKLNPRSMADEKSIHMKILTTDKDTYTFEFNIVGQNNKERGTARRVN